MELEEKNREWQIRENTLWVRDVVGSVVVK